MRHVEIILTAREARAVIQCLQGEVENEDNMHGDYFRTLRRALGKLRADVNAGGFDSAGMLGTRFNPGDGTRADHP